HPALFSADRSLANHFAVSFSALLPMQYYMPIQQAGSLVQRTISHIATYTGKQFQMTGGRKELLHCHQDRCNRIEEALLQFHASPLIRHSLNQKYLSLCVKTYCKSKRGCCTQQPLSNICLLLIPG